jgi:hypothetical protein
MEVPMKRHASLLGFSLCLAVALAGIGCTGTDSVVDPDSNAVVTAESPVLLKVGRTQVWADCELFDSVVTPATFKPESGNFDRLYAGSFQDGMGLISESKPGDSDYNGGRWHVYGLRDGVPADKYAGACSDENFEAEDFVPTDMYFECPLLPRRGNK